MADTLGGGFDEMASLLDNIETSTLVGCIISFRNSEISFCNIQICVNCPENEKSNHQTFGVFMLTE